MWSHEGSSDSDDVSLSGAESELEDEFLGEELERRDLFDIGLFTK
jgi:hypothetical protein